MFFSDQLFNTVTQNQVNDVIYVVVIIRTLSWSKGCANNIGWRISHLFLKASHLRLLNHKPWNNTQAAGDRIFITLHSQAHDLLMRLGETLSTFAPVTFEEVHCLIGCTFDKSPPLDIQPASLLKSGIEGFFKVITRLVNISFSQGTFLELLKEAQITHLLKRHRIDEFDPASYRPISHLNIIRKIVVPGHDPPICRFIAEF